MAARDANRHASELLTGALRKIAVALYHAPELARVLEESNVYEIALQAHFEGLLYADPLARLCVSRARGGHLPPRRRLLVRASTALDVGPSKVVPWECLEPP
jgi:hypothetical protein